MITYRILFVIGDEIKKFIWQDYNISIITIYLDDGNWEYFWLMCLRI